LARVVGIVLLVGLVASVSGIGRRGAEAGSAPVTRPVAAQRPASAAAPGRRLITRAAITRARRFARSRRGVVAFAVLDGEHRPRGLRRTVPFPSASVSKAMLLVALLRRAAHRRLSGAERSLLRPMITASDNDSASAVYALVGGDGMREVARAAGMRKFVEVGYWSDAQITAADQARLFLRIDKLVPMRHRRYARSLLSSIVREQRWGIAPVARLRHLRSFFKGGWRAGITHQVALLERGNRRVAIAVLTKPPSIAYGEETIERIARRVLTRAP
jgi:Beta-lactamase enzyme family